MHPWFLKSMGVFVSQRNPTSAAMGLHPCTLLQNVAESMAHHVLKHKPSRQPGSQLPATIRSKARAEASSSRADAYKCAVPCFGKRWAGLGAHFA